MPERPSVRRDARLGSSAVAPLRSRRLDAGRRPPDIFALLAGRRRVGLVPRPGETGACWKRHVHDPGGARAGQPSGHGIAAARDRARPRARAGDRLPARGAGRRALPQPPTRSCMRTRSIATSAGPMPAGAVLPARLPSAASPWWRPAVPMRRSAPISTACGEAIHRSAGSTAGSIGRNSRRCLRARASMSAPTPR